MGDGDGDGDGLWGLWLGRMEGGCVWLVVVRGLHGGEGGMLEGSSERTWRLGGRGVEEV